MKLKQVLISYKQSTCELYVDSKTERHLRRLGTLGHSLLARLEDAHRAHKEGIAHVKDVLKRYGVGYHTRRRTGLNPVQRADLVIAIGGDGTFLRTAHFVRGTLPLIGVNSSPGHSVGALCTVSADDFEAKLVDILEDRAPVVAYTRLLCHLNRKALPELILNDALVSSACPAGASRYRLFDEDLEEEQKSSGIWIAAPAGSSAAIGAAGGALIKNRAARSFQYAVREPYTPSPHPYRLVRRTLEAQDKLRVVSEMGDGALYLDGPRVIYPFTLGDEASFSLSASPLWVVE